MTTELKSGEVQAAVEQHPDSFADAFLFDEGVESNHNNTRPISTYDISDPDELEPGCCYTPYKHLVVLDSTSVSYTTTKRHGGAWCCTFSDGREEIAVPFSTIGCITLVQDEDGLPVIFTDSDLTPFAPFETDVSGDAVSWRRTPITLYNQKQAWLLVNDLKDRLTAKGLASGKAIYSVRHIEDQIKPHTFKEYLRVRSQVAQGMPQQDAAESAGAANGNSNKAEVNEWALGRASTNVGGIRASADGSSAEVVSRPIGGGEGRRGSQDAAIAAVVGLGGGGGWGGGGAGANGTTISQQPRQWQATMRTKEDVANRIRELRAMMHQGVISAKSAIARQALGSSWRSPSEQLAQGLNVNVRPEDPRTIHSLAATHAGSTAQEAVGPTTNADPRTIHSLSSSPRTPLNAIPAWRSQSAQPDKASGLLKKITGTQPNRQVSSLI